MSHEERKEVAREVFKGSMELVDFREGDDASANFLMCDAYGKIVFNLPKGMLIGPAELRVRLEGFKRSREKDIAEWVHLRNWSRELGALLAGEIEDDAEERREWMPELVLRRFREDFQFKMPLLEKYVSDPDSVGVGTLVAELRGVPETWEKRDED